MDLSRASEIISGTECILKLNYGYMVSFYWKIGAHTKCPDYFPNPLKGEDLFQSESIAWNWAREFALKTKGTCVDITVVKRDFTIASDPDNIITNDE